MRHAPARHTDGSQAPQSTLKRGGPLEESDPSPDPRDM